MGALWYEATVGKNSTFEANSLQSLCARIAAYYADSSERCEESGLHSAPDVTALMRYENDEEIKVSAADLKTFNRDVSTAFDELIESGENEEAYRREVSNMHGRL